MSISHLYKDSAKAISFCVIVLITLCSLLYLFQWEMFFPILESPITRPLYLFLILY